MSPRETDLRALRAGLLFCSPDWRPRIEARIAEIGLPREERSGTAREAPSTGMRDGTATEPVQTAPETSVGVQPAAPASRRFDGDWRAARLALREAGHEVNQHGGVVFVDGRPSDDQALYP